VINTIIIRKAFCIDESWLVGEVLLKLKEIAQKMIKRKMELKNCQII
jgi:hypothetical protein